MIENNNLPISDGKISKKQHHMFGFKATVCILGLVKIQGSKKAMRKKFCIGDLSSTEEVRMAQAIDGSPRWRLLKMEQQGRRRICRKEEMVQSTSCLGQTIGRFWLRAQFTSLSPSGQWPTPGD
ncbi:unnamed protein product [Prunus armeniaca]